MPDTEDPNAGEMEPVACKIPYPAVFDEDGVLMFTVIKLV
jgi:hypothetical protein